MRKCALFFVIFFYYILVLQILYDSKLISWRGLLEAIEAAGYKGKHISTSRYSDW